MAGNGDCVGIIAGYPISDTTGVGNYFYISRNNSYNELRAYVGHMQCMQPIAEVILKKNVCQLDDQTETKLAIERTNNELYFYVNDQLIYRNDYMADQKYANFGLVTPSKNTVTVTSSMCYNKANESLRASTENGLSTVFANRGGAIPFNIPNTIK